MSQCDNRGRQPEIPRPSTWDGAKNVVNNGIFTTNLDFLAGFSSINMYVWCLEVCQISLQSFGILKKNIYPQKLTAKYPKWCFGRCDSFWKVAPLAWYRRRRHFRISGLEEVKIGNPEDNQQGEPENDGRVGTQKKVTCIFQRFQGRLFLFVSGRVTPAILRQIHIISLVHRENTFAGLWFQSPQFCKNFTATNVCAVIFHN